MPLVALPGSEKKFARNVRAIIPKKEHEAVTVSVILKKERSLHTSAYIEAFAKANALSIVSYSDATHTVKLTGSLLAIEKAFNVSTQRAMIGKTAHRIRSGSIFVPEEIATNVIAVLGIDNRPAAKPHFHKRGAIGPAPNGYTMAALIERYNIPVEEGKGGEGQSIGIIELGGGYTQADLEEFAKTNNLQPLNVNAINVDGASNSPGQDADAEVLLDIQVIGAIANKAKIDVYFAPNTDQGFVDAISEAGVSGICAMSISWGGPEDSWTSSGLAAMNQAIEAATEKGVTVTVAAGDNGYTDGEGQPTVDFPGSSPYSLCCGGTTLLADSAIVWGTNDDEGQTGSEGATGGGFSKVFAKPEYQPAKVLKEAGGTGAFRGVPDVAGDADPNTGYQIVIDGQVEVIGGTSAVAPLWSGIVALLNNVLGAKLGLIQPSLVEFHANHGFHICKTGNNGLWKAKAIWNACTGWGEPNCRSLIKGFESLSGEK